MFLFQQRASGELQTLAAWMREFISGHPDYKHDSFVSDRIVYDMLKMVTVLTLSLNISFISFSLRAVNLWQMCYLNENAGTR